MVAMSPLLVRAKIAGEVALPNGPIHLDSLLAWATLAQIGKEREEGPLVDVDIPVAKEPRGRFHLATWGFCVPEEAALRWVNRRFPLTEAQELGNAKLRSINIQGGPCKSYRLPLPTMQIVNDTMAWWCVGDGDAIADLLNTCVGYLGKRRATGLGKVVRWDVTPYEPWGDGFPVVREGQPMRPLPTDWPGLRGRLELRHAVLTYPYHRHTAEELLATPSWPITLPAWTPSARALA